MRVNFGNAGTDGAWKLNYVFQLYLFASNYKSYNDNNFLTY
jgi:hypothetical protein